jgi:hypothetical protein
LGDHDHDSTTANVPIGFIPFNGFSGNFNGNGFIIRNLYINQPKEYGISLFGNLALADIKRLGIVNCDISCRSGGVIGSTIENSSISECFATGKIVAYDTSEGCVGGFCEFINASDISNCFTLCSASNPVSKNDYVVSSFSFGWEKLGNATYSFAAGKVISTRNTCAFGVFENGYGSYWDIETTGIPDNDPDTYSHGLTTSEMMKQKTYSGWDFKNIWCIDEGKDYPKLRVFGGCPTDVKSNEPVLDLVSISPNPTSDFIEISVGANGRSPLQSDIKIYNIYGQTVLSVGVQNFEPLRINVSGLAPGMHFVRIGEKIGKFIKL